MSCLKLFPFTPDRRAELNERAAADNHIVLYPTHMVLDGPEIVGYGSVFATPIVGAWMDSKKVNALGSMKMLGALESALRFNGLKEYIMPCSRQSPYFLHMERMGYSPIGENVWFYKNLTKE